MKLKKSIFVIFSFFSMVSCGLSQVDRKEKVVKNVILLISDGTGLYQISSSFYFKKTKSNYERFENIGLIKTSSSGFDVTDSAAGATAFACGEKSFNGAVGVADDSTAIKNLVEIGYQNNIKTGVIATSSIIHATPASFYAHQFSRQMNDAISKDLVESEVDFFAGGVYSFLRSMVKLIYLKN
ncbi:alkaline phosphatase [Joostella atrarenae]|uniref:alkaline phosphatase n=1 Tax=Joostella atrarenae TaxID=679257 RepID=UPI0021D45C91|nr:alkaline phosphatase [Joostella atrarenae]